MTHRIARSGDESDFEFDVEQARGAKRGLGRIRRFTLPLRPDDRRAVDDEERLGLLLAEPAVHVARRERRDLLPVRGRAQQLRSAVGLLLAVLILPPDGAARARSANADASAELAFSAQGA